MSNLIDEALIIATDAHFGQTRKYSGQPYIFHPIRVMLRVEQMENVEPHHVAAAVCHDVIEDCEGYDYELLAKRLGKLTADIVRELTNPSKGSRESRRVRKQMDRDHLATVAERLPGADAVWVHRIKLVDRIDNLRSMTGCCDERFLRMYADESRALCSVIGGACARLESELLSECERMVVFL